MPNGAVKLLKSKEPQNRLFVMLPSKKPLKSTKHSANLILKSSLMSEALRLHILLNQKKLFYQKRDPALLQMKNKDLYW
ncbi:hypothetical protein t0870 [Salmonella enterica subsp. enterica serovar Typhi str. Ty2]|uniref:Cytoplasmic protein n=1 Tax=Salmonella typhi TaxID=90370 RepID=A0A0H2VKL7_SALTI|nr:hypothetical protein t0870 [Salmonella enterica subsp. enterica serovar Typhi str. Ty2]